jgi:hypothetical protein
MSFVPSFSVSQGVDVTSFIITDTSTGSDSSISSRQVFLTKSDGTYLVPSGTSTNYITWSIGATTLTVLGVLNVDYCLNITVNWLNSSGTILYTTSQIYCFTGNSETFYYSLTTTQASNPRVVNNADWYNNKLQLRVEIDSATQALGYSDQTSAQQCLNRAQDMITNSTLFFP